MPVLEDLRRALVAAGLSNNEIGRQAGVNPAQVTRFLNETRGISVETVEKLAEALGLKLILSKRNKGD